MAKVVYKSYNRNEGSLFPEYLSDMVPAEHPARVVDTVIENLDIRELERTYKGGGTSSYAPRALLKVVIYAYLSNIYSGRQIEKTWRESIIYMWLGGTQIPDFRTINNFRSKRLVGTFEGLFTQVVKLLVDKGLVTLDVQYIDGTKIESVANKYTFVWKRATETNKAKLEKNVRAVLEEAERTLEMEQRESELEKPLTAKEMEERTERILEKMKAKEANGEGATDKQHRKAVEKVAKESVGKMREYEEKLEILGKRNSYSKTDPDATFMRMKEDAMNNGQTKPGYNVQIATENQYITNYGIYWRPTDQGTLIPFMTTFSERYGIQSSKAVADSGYGSEQNYAWMEENGIEAFVKYNMFHAEDKRKYRKDAFLVQNLYYNAEEDYYVCPMGQHMEHIGDVQSKSDLGYVSTVSRYRARNCVGCPLRCLCYKGKGDRGSSRSTTGATLSGHKRRSVSRARRGSTTGAGVPSNRRPCSGTSNTTTASGASASGAMRRSVSSSVSSHWPTTCASTRKYRPWSARLRRNRRLSNSRKQKKQTPPEALGRGMGCPGACPPPDEYRGRGPTDTSSAKRDAGDVGRGRSGAKRNGVPRTSHTPPT